MNIIDFDEYSLKDFYKIVSTNVIRIRKEKKLSQLRVYSDETRSELEDKISELTEQLESLQTDDVLKQKLEYWKDKAKAETARIENLEKQIIAYADGVTLNKIFG